MTFKDALWDLILGGSGRISDGYTGSYLLVFALGCAIMGFIAVVLDRIVYEVRGRSIFHLTYGGGYSKDVLVVRPLGPWSWCRRLSRFRGEHRTVHSRCLHRCRSRLALDFAAPD